jgi:hypothetical protein
LSVLEQQELQGLVRAKAHWAWAWAENIGAVLRTDKVSASPGSLVRAAAATDFLIPRACENILWRPLLCLPDLLSTPSRWAAGPRQLRVVWSLLYYNDSGMQGRFIFQV